MGNPSKKQKQVCLLKKSRGRCGWFKNSLLSSQSQTLPILSESHSLLCQKCLPTWSQKVWETFYMSHRQCPKEEPKGWWERRLFHHVLLSYQRAQETPNLQLCCRGLNCGPTSTPRWLLAEKSMPAPLLSDQPRLLQGGTSKATQHCTSPTMKEADCSWERPPEECQEVTKGTGSRSDDPGIGPVAFCLGMLVTFKTMFTLL